jgi:hypothetical protein
MKREKATQYNLGHTLVLLALRSIGDGNRFLYFALSYCTGEKILFLKKRMGGLLRGRACHPSSFQSFIFKKLPGPQGSISSRSLGIFFICSFLSAMTF